MVSPRLVLTNHHVLPSAATAQASTIEFDFEDGIDGQSLRSTSFRLDPERFFVANKARDFALVAVLASEDELAQFGFNPMIAEEGKAIVGDYVAIVQHPGGNKKMVALRENRVVDLDGSFIHYEADTEPGSSGSPVFSKEWSLVGLHHASVAAPEHDELGGFMNEGIRISRILKFLHEQRLAGRQLDLFKQLTATGRVEFGPVATRPNGDSPAVEKPTPDGDAAPRFAPADGAGSVRLTVPLELTVQLGAPTVLGPQLAVAVAAPVVDVDSEQEAIEIDPDYKDRKGYDVAFLGAKHRVPFPKVTGSAAANASRRLPYHHFSLVMNKDRRLAFFTAVNIDGTKDDDPPREDDKWTFDPRLDEKYQVGEEVYKKNPLDRGHLVRRLDPAWGKTAEERKRANDDTFHFTNCAPQHEDFNQNKSTWAGLEDYILRNAQNRDFKACVFSGPVFAPDDDEFKDVKLPRQFWKVAVMKKKSGTLSATGYLLSQEKLIAGLEDTEFSYGAYKTFQVPIGKVEGMTQLDFGGLKDVDPLEQPGEESTARGKEITGPGDLVL
jgi:endonuclease G